MMRAGIFALAVLMSFSATLAYAQDDSFQIPGLGSTLSIVSNPQYPAPGQSVHLTLESSYIDLSNSTISWSVNGKVAQSGMGDDSLDVTVGALGSETDVTAGAISDGGNASASVSLVPTQVDLLWEANSYTPPFYEGRAIPSAGTSLHLYAIAHFGSTPSSKIIYTWKRNGQKIASVSGLGKSAVTIDSPSLFETDTITVDAQTQDQSLSGENAVTLSSIDPVLEMYQDNPLLGITYKNALGDSTAIQESTMTFVAIPYFAQAQSPDDSRLIYSWSVNNSGIAADTKRPSEITVSAKDGGGVAIDLSLTHATNIFMSSSRTWNITFTPGAGGAFGDPNSSSASTL